MQTLFSCHQDRLSNLTQQLESRLSLRERLLTCLSSAAQLALLDACINDDTLELLTTNASWASRFRLSRHQLLKACNNANVHKLSVHINSQQTDAVIKPVGHQRSKPSAETLEALGNLNNQLDPHDALSLSLKRLIHQLSQTP